MVTGCESPELFKGLCALGQIIRTGCEIQKILLLSFLLPTSSIKVHFLLYMCSPKIPFTSNTSRIFLRHTCCPEPPIPSVPMCWCSHVFLVGPTCFSGPQDAHSLKGSAFHLLSSNPGALEQDQSYIQFFIEDLIWNIIQSWLSNGLDLGISK